MRLAHILKIYLRRRNSWAPTLLFVPILYCLGWLLVRPLLIIPGNPFRSSLSLLGTLISFLFFISFIPFWGRTRWQASRPWSVLGLCSPLSRASVIGLLRGLIWSIGLLALLVIIVLLGSWGSWLGAISFSGLLNAFLLAIVVSFAEELIFRGWLWEELNQLLGPFFGFFGQAAIFSLVHIQPNIDLISMCRLLLGLFLLGMVLAVCRWLDGGLIWGSVALHGGLVGGWFALNNGIIDFSAAAPIWLVGPGSFSPNPIGGSVAILALFVFLLIQFTAVAMAGRPFTGALSASSKGANP